MSHCTDGWGARHGSASTGHLPGSHHLNHYCHCHREWAAALFLRSLGFLPVEKHSGRPPPKGSCHWFPSTLHSTFLLSHLLLFQPEYTFLLFHLTAVGVEYLHCCSNWTESDDLRIAHRPSTLHTSIWNVSGKLLKSVTQLRRVGIKEAAKWAQRRSYWEPWIYKFSQVSHWA